MSRRKAIPKGAYGVKLVRGPFVVLPRHPQHFEDKRSFLDWAREQREAGARLAADLFSGAGGLSLGLESAGWQVVLSADHFAEAVETHSHHFPGMSVDWDLGDADRIADIARLIREAGIELLAGGPPCQPFSRAGRAIIRKRVLEHLRDPRDERRELWRSFMEIIKQATPKIVIMENVPDMALDREMFILRDMVHELEELGYSVEEKVIDTWRYGVPQFRRRLILVALAQGVRFRWPQEVEEKLTVNNAIGDLPEVEGGWRPEGGAEGWADYNAPITEYQHRMRVGVPAADRQKIFDHITRPVRPDDLEIFELLEPGMLYTDVPEHLRRYRTDIFDDKYNRLDGDKLSRTIVAHIARDGYHYIHPQQPRTLTVREAARLQTFPDWFRFAGPPSLAFKQIGNAVPPMLGQHLGMAVADALRVDQPAPYTTAQISARLAAWFERSGSQTMPWLKAQTRWQLIQAEMMLDRATPDEIRNVWPLLREWATPKHTVDQAPNLRIAADWVNRSARADQILKIAHKLIENDDALHDDVAIRKIPGLNMSFADLAILAVPRETVDAAQEDDNARPEEPVLVTKGVLRVAARFRGEDDLNRKNRMSDGRLAMARMVGFGPEARRAHLAIIEIANSHCAGNKPLCAACPLQDYCVEALTLKTKRDSLL